MSFRKLGLFVLFILFSNQVLASYNVVDRFRIIEDKLKTQEMLNPYGHDFLLDINATANLGIINMVKDIGKLDTTTATPFVNENENTEKFLKAKINIGIPIFNFTIFGIQLKPNFRFGFNVGSLLAFTPSNSGVESILNFVPSEIKSLVTPYVPCIDAKMSLYSYDIVKTIVTEPTCAATPADIITLTPFVGKYFFPNGGLPLLNVMLEADLKTGFYIDYFKDEWYGSFNITTLARTDISLKVATDALANGVNPLSSMSNTKNLNLQAFAVADYKLARKIGRFSIMGAVEDLRLYRFYDDIKKGGNLNDTLDPLLRLHADARFEWAAFSLTPFIGVHKRAGYGFENGVYAGADWGTFIWKDRIGLQMRTMADNEQFTFAPRLKLWLMQLEYSLKLPIRKEIDHMKVATIHTLDFRLFY